MARNTLYILDDESFVRRLIEIIARSAGLETRSFANAVDFLDVYSPEMTGCIITDLRMPLVSGLELIDRLLEKGCTMPIILSSAADDPDLPKLAETKGVFAFLTKPLDKKTLQGTLENAMVSGSYKP